MLPDAPVYPQVYPATFTDAFGTEETVIRFMGPGVGAAPYFRMDLRGTAFGSQGLVMWHPCGQPAANQLQQFEIHRLELHYHRLRTFIPLTLVDAGGTEHAAGLHLAFEGTGERGGVLPPIGFTVTAAVEFAGTWYYGPSPGPVWIDQLLYDLQRELRAGGALKTCRACRHYGPGETLVAECYCLRRLRTEEPRLEDHEIYREYYGLTDQASLRIEQNHPLHWCRHFAPRLPDADSRN